MLDFQRLCSTIVKAVNPIRCRWSIIQIEYKMCAWGGQMSVIFVLYSVKSLMLEKTAPVQYSRGKIVLLILQL
ncbi:hypothetical protein AWJ19_22935 [Paenibacillus sp. DMB5]|nr:hypothetical protein AWJ19_22935 [Paenibacillus sp. DMB5]